MLMDDISRYVADEDDLAFEYELQRTSAERSYMEKILG